MDIAIGKSKLVPTFLISDGARFNTILRCGRSIHTLRNVALIRSFDSLIAASGSQIISIVGSDLLASASTSIGNHCNHTVANVCTFCIDIVRQ